MKKTLPACALDAALGGVLVFVLVIVNRIDARHSDRAASSMEHLLVEEDT
jgi:hypothetical protein